MSNFDYAVDVLFRHREARQWTDEAVARDLLARFGIDPAGDVDAVPPVEAPVAPVPVAAAAPPVEAPAAEVPPA